MSEERVTLHLNTRTATINGVVGLVLLIGGIVNILYDRGVPWLSIPWGTAFIVGGLHGFSRLTLRLTLGPQGLVRTGRYFAAHRRTWGWEDVRLVVTRNTRDEATPVTVILDRGRLEPDIAHYADAHAAMPIISSYLPAGSIRDYAEWQASCR